MIGAGILVIGGGAVIAGAPVWVGVLAIILAALYLRKRTGVPVLAYHSVSSDPSWLPWGDNISVRPEVFAKHMQVLKDARWEVICDDQLFARMPQDANQNKKQLVLHFDDAYADVLANAVPILKRFGFAACTFASSDFVDSSTGIRPGLGAAPKGYLNADELRQMDRDPLLSIASHGKDHARIATGPTVARRADPSVWGGETAWLWSMMQGDKSRWFEQTPPDNADIPANDSALTGQGPDESPAEQAARVTQNLKAARAELGAILERDVTYLCWPFDRVTPAAKEAARAAGFTRFTGGRADNAPHGGSDTVSRTHINDHAAGPAPLWVEGLIFRAKLEVASGNLLWWPVTTLAALRRKRHFRFLHGHAA